MERNMKYVFERTIYITNTKNVITLSEVKEILNISSEEQAHAYV